MNKFIEFLLVSLDSIDGYRGTATNYVEYLVKHKLIKLTSEKLKKKTLEELYCRAFGKFNLMRCRMKISYHALVQQKTIFELLITSIMNTFQKFNCLSVVLSDVGMKSPKIYPQDMFNEIMEGKMTLRYFIMHVNKRKDSVCMTPAEKLIE